METSSRKTLLEVLDIIRRLGNPSELTGEEMVLTAREIRQKLELMERQVAEESPETMEEIGDNHPGIPPVYQPGDDA